MYVQEAEDVKKIQLEIENKVSELGEIIKSTKLGLNNYQPEKSLLQFLLQGHYSEIIHHLNQINYHLQKINNHSKSLNEIEEQIKTNNKNQTNEFNHDDAKKSETENPQRLEEERLRIRNRRITRTSSLKYVLQWEKMLDEQREDCGLHSVKRRWKSEDLLNGRESAEPVERDLSKKLVKNRIQKFEGFTKPQRASSTIEAFLEISGTKPHEVMNVPIPEGVEGNSDLSKLRSSSSKIANDDNLDPDNCSKEDGAQANSSTHFEDKIVDSKSPNENLTTSKINVVEEQSKSSVIFLKEISSTSYNSLLETEVSENNDLSNTALNNSTNRIHVTTENSDDTETSDEEGPTKPRIVGIHYKQPSPTDAGTQILLV